jgi:hypothetical protein
VTGVVREATPFIGRQLLQFGFVSAVSSYSVCLETGHLPATIFVLCNGRAVRSIATGRRTKFVM